MPAALIGATAVRYIYYLITVGYFEPNWFLLDLFFGIQLGVVFAFALGYVGARTAPTYKATTAMVLSAILALLSVYLLIYDTIWDIREGIIPPLDVPLDFGEGMSVAIASLMLTVQTWRGKDVWMLRTD